MLDNASILLACDSGTFVVELNGMTALHDSSDPESPALEDVEFLARSPHRIEVLGALADAPRTRHELRERAEVSRVTISRLLDDLTDRGWIVHDNGQYEATARGRLVSSEFARLLGNLTVGDRLDDALEWLPVAEFEFDLARLRDADVLRAASWESQTEAIRHAADCVDGTDEIRGTGIGFSHEVVDAIRERVVEDGSVFEMVVDDTALRMIRNDEGLRHRFQAILNAETGALHRYAGTAPLHMVATFDELVVICGHVEDGPPPGTLETTDPEVHRWARAYYEGALADASPVEVETLTAQ